MLGYFFSQPMLYEMSALGAFCFTPKVLVSCLGLISYAQMRARPTMDEPLTRANREKIKEGFMDSSSAMKVFDNDQNVNKGVFASSFVGLRRNQLIFNDPGLSLVQMRELAEDYFDKEICDRNFSKIDEKGKVTDENFASRVGQTSQQLLFTTPAKRPLQIKGLAVPSARILAFGIISFIEATGYNHIFNDIDLVTTDTCSGRPVRLYFTGKRLRFTSFVGDSRKIFFPHVREL
jgi:hypothetical protein